MQVCASEKVVTSANIEGIILLGSESPIEAIRSEEAIQMALSLGEQPPESTMVKHDTRPVGIPPEQMLFVHSSQDRVIHYSQIEQLADAWGGTFVKFDDCDVQPEHPGVPWANDLQHDFLTYNMLINVVQQVFKFLGQ
jgi:hypothetical protein